jgi:NADH:ubiquinone oxidoreductase subunit E
LSEVESLEGEPGNFSVTLKKQPRYVDETKCTGCAACVENCPIRNIVQIAPEEGIDLEPHHRKTVTEIIDRHRHREGPLMPILQDINAVFNYFPDSVLKYVARETGYPFTHLFRIATFYSAFSVTPRGKHVINVCLGTACYVRGSGRVMERFGEVLGIAPEETTSDLRFTLQSVRCIGCCGLAPAMAIGDVVHGKMTTSRVRDIVGRYRDT